MGGSYIGGLVHGGVIGGLTRVSCGNSMEIHEWLSYQKWYHWGCMELFTSTCRYFGAKIWHFPSRLLAASIQVHDPRVQ